MTARTKARKRALDILFESEQRRVDPLTTLRDRQSAAADHPINDYTVTLVEGVTATLPQLDLVIAEASKDWPVDRMPAVDRTVLRLATWELLYGDVPPAVAVNEAVALCSDLSTDDSPGFVNGVLARVMAEHSRTGGQTGSHSGTDPVTVAEPAD